MNVLLLWPIILLDVTTGMKRQVGTRGSTVPTARTVFDPFSKTLSQNLGNISFLLKNGANWAFKKFNLIIHSKGIKMTRTWEGAQQGIAIKNSLPTVSRFLAACPWWLNQAAAGKCQYSCECALLEAQLSRNLATIVYTYLHTVTSSAYKRDGRRA